MKSSGVSSVGGVDAEERHQVDEGPGFPFRQMEEVWEMNIHVNPLDDETADQIKRNKLSLYNDPYFVFVRQHEKARKNKIYQSIF
jgi:hypothetical protein